MIGTKVALTRCGSAPIIMWHTPLALRLGTFALRKKEGKMHKRLLSKLGIALIIVGSVFILTAAAALAASLWQLEPAPLVGASSGSSVAPLLDDEDPEDSGDADDPQLGFGGLAIASVISNTFSDTISYTTVISMRMGEYLDAPDRVFGWGEIFKLAWLATYTDTLGVGDLAALRDSGLGWGQIISDVTHGQYHGFGRLAGDNQDDMPRNLGQTKKCQREGNCPEPEPEAVTSANPSPGGGNAYGHDKDGDNNPGRGQERGRGRDKDRDRGGGKKD